MLVDWSVNFASVHAISLAITLIIDMRIIERNGEFQKVGVEIKVAGVVFLRDFVQLLDGIDGSASERQVQVGRQSGVTEDQEIIVRGVHRLQG